MLKRKIQDVQTKAAEKLIAIPEILIPPSFDEKTIDQGKKENITKKSFFSLLF